jgi:hypothetical protein
MSLSWRLRTCWTSWATPTKAHVALSRECCTTGSLRSHKSPFIRFSLNLVVGILLLGLSAFAQEPLPGKALSDYIVSNERFGHKLLIRMSASSPDRNIVVSPISVSCLFAALREGSHEEDLRKELQGAFEWTPMQELAIPNRILMTRFEKPRLVSKTRAGQHRTRADFILIRYSPEELWMSNELLYRRTKRYSQPFSEYFVADAKRNFGVQFRLLPDDHSSSPTLPRVGKAHARAANGANETDF